MTASTTDEMILSLESLNSVMKQLTRDILASVKEEHCKNCKLDVKVIESKLQEITSHVNCIKTCRCI